jgi:hypothetical protein
MRIRPLPSPVVYQRASTGRAPDASTRPTHLSLPLHGQAGRDSRRIPLPAQKRLRLTLDLARRGLDLFAEIGAVEVVKGVVAPLTPGIETWWIAVKAPRERGWPSTCGRLRWSTGQTRPVDKPDAKLPTAKNGALLRLSPSFLSSERRRTVSRLHLIPNEMNVKRWSKPTAEETKNP